MTRFPLVLFLLAASGSFAPARWAHPARESPRVVINEIMYHAPDDLDDLQFIELYNPGRGDVDLSGWKLARAVNYTFPDKSTIKPDGFLVICKNAQEFKKYYQTSALGVFEGKLSHSGENLELLDRQGKKVDGVRYRSRAPWPASADGYGASLERVCPTSAENGPRNWAPSALKSGPPAPGGTPGKRNSCFSSRVPPAVTKVTCTPGHATPDQDVTVEASVQPEGTPQAVELLYRIASTGMEAPEKAVPMKLSTTGRYSATIPRQQSGQIIRFRIKVLEDDGPGSFHPHPHDLRPAFSCYVHDKFEPGKIPFGYIINVSKDAVRENQREVRRMFGNRPQATPPGQGKSAFVYVDPKTGEPQLFDFISVIPRSGGRKVHFHKDRPLGDMTTINLIYEYQDRFVLAEPLAYEVYRQAGNAAPRADFVRTWMDGKPIGFQLLVEQPNRAFLRHLKMESDGNLYKCNWLGSDVVSTHEKKTHTHAGKEDLVELHKKLTSTKGDEQWEVIRKNFDVPQVATFYAVHILLSDWDGYFNNHFLYHDVSKTKKWTMYPWDQDKTWGIHDGVGEYGIFYDMPVTMGMTGDKPPGWPKDRPAPRGFGFSSVWWRPPGQFSGPLLANAEFRKVYLARTKELLEKVYTEEVFFPIIQQLGERLEDEVKVRAELLHQDPKQAVEHLQKNLESLREHLRKRRKFLLEQEELKSVKL